jgi:hypothetical protein
MRGAAGGRARYMMNYAGRRYRDRARSGSAPAPATGTSPAATRLVCLGGATALPLRAGAADSRGGRGIPGRPGLARGLLTDLRRMPRPYRTLFQSPIRSDLTVVPDRTAGGCRDPSPIAPRPPFPRWRSIPPPIPPRPRATS